KGLCRGLMQDGLRHHNRASEDAWLSLAKSWRYPVSDWRELGAFRCKGHQHNDCRPKRCWSGIAEYPRHHSQLECHARARAPSRFTSLELEISCLAGDG